MHSFRLDRETKEEGEEEEERRRVIFDLCVIINLILLFGIFS